jgi:ribonuclease P protein component
LRQHSVSKSGGTRFGFPKRTRLLRAADYRKVYDRGRRRNLDFLLAFVLENGEPVSRVGLTVSRAVGSSVERNRVKRRLRETVRKHLPELGPGWDIVLNARPAVKEVEFAVLDETVRKFFLACARGEPRAARS